MGGEVLASVEGTWDMDTTQMVTEAQNKCVDLVEVGSVPACFPVLGMCTLEVKPMD